MTKLFLPILIFFNFLNGADLTHPLLNGKSDEVKINIKEEEEKEITLVVFLIYENKKNCCSRRIKITKDIFTVKLPKKIYSSDLENILENAIYTDTNYIPGIGYLEFTLGRLRKINHYKNTILDLTNVDFITANQIPH